MLSFVPKDMIPRLVLLLLGAIFFFAAAVVALKKRKKMACDVWIAVFVFSIALAIGMLWVAVCVMALFTVAE